MMKKRITLALVCAAWVFTAGAQNMTVESIRKVYQEVHERIVLMTPNEEGMTAWPPEYFDLNVVQNLPGTGPHHESIRMFYDEEEAEDSDNPPVYPPHFLRFVTAKYNFAVREFYEEYLYDEKGNVLFIYAITPDVVHDGEMVPYELRLWFDGRRLLQFTAKKAEDTQGRIDIASLRKVPFKEVFSGKNIPDLFREETGRCQQRAKRFLEMFKGIDNNTYL